MLQQPMGQLFFLSSKFNMSLGFIPVIIAIAATWLTEPPAAIYAGTGVGIILSGILALRRGAHIPPFLLYATTGALVLLSLAVTIYPTALPKTAAPLIIEVAVLVAPLLIVLLRHLFLDCQRRRSSQCCKQFAVQGAEATIVSSRVVLLTGAFHLLILITALGIRHPLPPTAATVLMNIAPLAVFVLSLLMNQWGIHYFNSLLRHTVFLPVVNTSGNVVGKCLAAEAVNHKQEQPNPYIRIAITSGGTVFLRPRPQCASYDKGLTDLPIEGYLLYGETLKQAFYRILEQYVPLRVPREDIHFHIIYHYENEQTNRLVYLFSVDLPDEPGWQSAPRLAGGKLWALRQIEQNLGNDYLSECFEQEYDQLLRVIICTREKYRESSTNQAPCPASPLCCGS